MLWTTLESVLRWRLCKKVILVQHLSSFEGLLLSLHLMTAVYGHIYVILTIYEIFEHNGHAAWMLVLFMIQYTIHQAHVHLVSLMKCDPWQVYTVMAKTQTTSRKKVIIVAFNMDLNLRYRQFYFYYTMNTIITLNSRHGELTIVMHPLNALIFWCNTIEIRPIGIVFICVSLPCVNQIRSIFKKTMSRVLAHYPPPWCHTAHVDLFFSTSRCTAPTETLDGYLVQHKGS